MNQKDINKIITKHNLWVKTKGVYGKKAVFCGADLRNADFFGVTLRYVDFSYSNLSQAFMAEADFTGSNFKGSILKNADLRYSIFKDANFYNADLTNANIG